MHIFDHMEFTGRLENFNTRLWTYHVKVPKTIALFYLDQGDIRVVATLNNSLTFQCAIMPAGEEVYFINLNKKIRDQLKLQEGSNIEVSLKKDESEYGLPFPDEFKELLAQDSAGNKLFLALTPGKQRNLLYAVGMVKNSDMRIHRSMIILDHLKKNKGKIDFRELNQEMRDKK
ncbi:MAG: YdeI/OmpD-associated family protein [Bacteroidota bacterium]|nr:YdeI/OmpD-associated family protein [Bacteroidota bacterium]